MPKFDVLIKPSVEKDLRKIPSTVMRQVLAAIEQIAETACKPPDKKLTATERTWRHRIGDYRIINEVDINCSTITIHHVRHRRDVYRRV